MLFRSRIDIVNILDWTKKFIALSKRSKMTIILYIQIKFSLVYRIYTKILCWCQTNYNIEIADVFIKYSKYSINCSNSVVVLYKLYINCRLYNATLILVPYNIYSTTKLQIILFISFIYVLAALQYYIPGNFTVVCTHPLSLNFYKKSCCFLY